MNRRTTPALIGAAAVLGIAPAAATAGEPIDRIEHLLGATYMTAQSGNGGLTVGVAPRGEVTVLSWPSPSFFDHVDFEAAAAVDARERPFFGALESEGVFGGLVLTHTSGDTAFVWLRDLGFEQTQRYASDTSAAVEHVATHPGLGLTVTQWTAVDADRDVVLRRTRVERDATSEYVAVRYLSYANLAPRLDRDPQDPREDDRDGDFLAWWEPDQDAVVHFRPGGDRADPAALDALLADDWSDAAAWAADGLPRLHALRRASLGEGVAIALASGAAPDDFHVGRDTDTPCGAPVAWTWLPEDTFDAAGSPGPLPGSPVAGCRTASLRAWDAGLGAAGGPALAEFDEFWGAAATPDDALRVVAAARHDGFDVALARTDAEGEAWLDSLHLPGPAALGADVQAFAQRTLLSLRQGTDRDTAAMVASVATQPAYHLDWPRDSTFFDYGLDVAGLWDQASAHQRFLASVQNIEAVTVDGTPDGFLQSPPGAWLMNFYADGLPATTSINHFEIDQVGLTLWSFWSHAVFASNDNAARDHLAAVWPAIERGADLLAACLDDTHPALVGTAPPPGRPAWWPAFEALRAGEIPDPDARAAAMAAGDWEAFRPCEASEDDNPVHSVSLYSTHTTRMGLLGAVRAARALCIDDPRIDYWEARAHELGAAAFKLYYAPGAGGPAGTWTGRGDWLLWPAPLAVDASLDEHFSTAADADARRAETLAFVHAALTDYAVAAAAEATAAAALETPGAAYEQKKTLSLARWWATTGVDSKLAGDNEDAIATIAADLSSPGTRHLGEVWVSVDDDGDGLFDRADNRTATPHLWTATLTYLSAMAVAAPERFRSDGVEAIGPFCDAGVEPVIFRESPSCGCDDDTTEAEAQQATFAFLLLLVPATIRRRRA